MGLKRRTVTTVVEEEYFQMEVSDIEQAYYNFYKSSFREPSIIIVHPEHRDELLNDFWSKIGRYSICRTSAPTNETFYRGVKIIFSNDIKKETVEIY